MDTTASVLMADLARVARERDALERQRQRTLYGLDRALEALRRRPELDDQDDWAPSAWTWGLGAA